MPNTTFTDLEFSLPVDVTNVVVFGWLADHVSPASASLLPSPDQCAAMTREAFSDLVTRVVINEALLRVLENAMNSQTAGNEQGET